MNGKPRIAVIGAGHWGINHVRVFHRLGVLAAVAEHDKERLKDVKQNYPGIKIQANYDDYLKDPGLDAFVIATPAADHYKSVSAALNAGKDVFVEKPMALSVKDAVELVKLAEEKRRILMVGHLLLYKPAVEQIVSAVREGLIGELLSVNMCRLKLGKVRRQENVLWSFAPHDAALLLHVVNAPVEKVWATGQAALQPQIEDDVRVHLQFGNGVRAHIHVSWLWPEDERKTVITGSKGMIVYNENAEEVLLYHKGVGADLNVFDKGMEKLPVPENSDNLEAEALHFIESIRSRKPPLTDGRKGLEVIRVLEKAGRELKKNAAGREFFAHDSACIDEPVQIGKGTRVWHFTHIMAGAEIGERCTIGQNVFISGSARIGSNVKIQNNVSIYDGVILEDDVFCGPSAVFTNITTPRSAFPRNTMQDYVKTIVRKGATIGANSTVVCGVSIGRHALVGAGAVVTKDIPDHAVVYGNPAAIKGWVCLCGTVIVDNDAMELSCEKCATHLKSGVSKQQHGT